jgi:hypothetical protein
MTDNVNHPAHYTGFSKGSEVIDITENLTVSSPGTPPKPSYFGCQRLV